MRGKLVSALLSVVLVAGLTPCLAWAASPLATAQTDLSVQAPADLDEARQAAADLTVQASADAEQARQKVADAQAAVDAAQAVVDKGSLGFFESVGATSAIDALTNAQYASYTHIGSETDATSLDNMKMSIDIVKRCNEIRKENGLGALSVTDYLMATSQSNANYADESMDHARQFNVAENLAWNWWSHNLPYGVKTAFVQWYDEEKEIWDSAKSTGKYTSKFDGGTYEIPASAFELSAYDLSGQYPDFYLNVGHYLNVIDPDYTVSGGAINTNGTNYDVTYAQNFNSGSSGDKAYSVADYRARFMEYYDKVCGDLDDAKARLSAAKAELAKFFTITDSDVSLAATSFTYNGAAKKPAVTVMLDGVKLSEGTDYTVKYSSNVNAGTASVTVAGKGDYSGKARASFKIAKAANPAKVTVKQKTVAFSKLKNKAQSVSPVSVLGAAGKVSYAKVSKGSSPKLSVNASTGKVTVNAKTKKGTYKVRVQVTVAGNGNYEPLSKTVLAKVKVQ